MPVVTTFAVVLLIMAVVVAISMKGDRKRRERLPPPVPRPVPPDFPTGVHLRWPNRSYPPLDPRTAGDDHASASFGETSGLQAVFEAAGRHDHRAAADRCRQLLDAALDGGRPTALLRYALAQSLIELGSYLEAEDVVQDGLASMMPADEPLRGDLVGKQGEIAWALGELDRAEMLLETAATLPRGLSLDGWIELHLGLVERDRGRTTEARQLVLAALGGFERRTGPEDSRPKLGHITLASIALAAGNLDEAAQQLDDAARFAPDDAFLVPYGRIVAAGIDRARGDSSAAIDQLTAAREAFDRLDLPPYIAEADLALARAHLDLGHRDEARGAYWRAIWAYDTFGCVSVVQHLRDEVATLPG